MSDPATVTTEQMRAAYDALGLDPERFTSTHSIRINPDGIEVLRWHTFEGVDGKARLIPGTDAIYAQWLTIRTEGFVNFGDVDVLAGFEEPERLRDRAAKLLAKADEVDAAAEPATT